MDTFEETIAYFDREAGGWSDRYSGSTQFPKRLRIVLSWIDDEKHSGRMLDYGCGSGVFAGELLRRGASVTCVDASPVMIETARRSLAELEPGVDPGRLELELVRAEGFDGDYLERHFDGVICLGVLEYVERHDLLLERLASVMQPGSFLIVSVPNRRSLLRGLERFIYRHPAPFRQISMVRHLTVDDCYLRYQKNQYTLSELDARVAKHGLVRERALYFAAPSILSRFENHPSIGFNLVAMYRRGH